MAGMSKDPSGLDVGSTLLSASSSGDTGAPKHAKHIIYSIKIQNPLITQSALSVDKWDFLGLYRQDKGEGPTLTLCKG